MVDGSFTVTGEWGGGRIGGREGGRGKGEREGGGRAGERERELLVCHAQVTLRRSETDRQTERQTDRQTDRDLHLPKTDIFWAMV